MWDIVIRLYGGSRAHLTAVLMPTEASTAAMTVVGTLMMGVLRRNKFAASPQTSRQTPPPIAMMGSLRLQ